MALYHYTDVNALLNIIGNNRLWLTHIRYMNDNNELMHCLDIVKKFVIERMKHGQGYPSLIEAATGKSFEGLEIDRLEEVNNAIGDGLSVYASSDLFEKTIEKADIYVMSFCKTSDDLLSQWRGYANESTGYCIGFNEDLLNDEITKQSQNIDQRKNIGMYLGDVVYDEAKVKKELEQYKKAIVDGTKAEYERALGRCLDVCAKAKNRAFEEEDEKRLIGYSSSNGSFEGERYRDRDGFIIPYTEIRIDVKAIESVTIGPSKNQRLAKNGLDRFLLKKGYSHIKVRTSDTPLRK